MLTAPPATPPFLQRLNMPEALPDDITRVLTDSQPPNNTDAKMTAAILAKITKGKASERVTARTDPRIIQRMTAALSRANTLKIMRALDATLSQRTPLATGAAFATPTTLKLVTTEIAASPAAQRRQVLTEPAAVNGIQTALSRPDSLKAMAALGASLRDILDAAMRGAGAESAAMVNAAAVAPAAPNGVASLVPGASLPIPLPTPALDAHRTDVLVTAFLEFEMEQGDRFRTLSVQTPPTRLRR